MNCTQCGAEAPASAAFCPQCGAGLKVGKGRVQVRGPAPDTPEEELWAGTYSPKAMIGYFVGAGLLTIIGMIVASFAGPAGWTAVVIGALILFGYLGLLLAYRRIGLSYRLTTQRLLRNKGILSRTGDHLLVVNIDDVTVYQGLIERMFNVGTIVLHTKDKTTQGEPDGVLTMKGIEEPRHLADLIDEVRRTERNRRGLYTMDA